MTGINDAVNPQAARNAAFAEWRRGWPVVLVGMLGFGISGLGVMSYGAFMAPLEAEFGWSRSAISGALTLPALIGVAFPVLVGAVVDRFGARVTAVIGALLVGITTCLLATATGWIINWYVLWTLYAMSCQIISALLWSVATASVFTQTRGLALSMTMTGSALAAVIAPFISDLLIEAHGFRAAYGILGITTGLLLAVLSFLAIPRHVIRPVPEPAMVATSTTENDDAGRTAGAPSMLSALKSATFLKLAFVVYAGQVTVLALYVHLIPLLGGAGLSRRATVIVSGSFGVAMLVGKLMVGFTMDRLPASRLLALLLALMAGGLAMLTVSPMTVGWAIVSVILYGVAFGGVSPIFPYLVARYFGLESFGRLYGALCGLSALAFATGPLMAGLIHDHTHSYRPLLIGSLPALLAAIVLTLSLREAPAKDRLARSAHNLEEQR